MRELDQRDVTEPRPNPTARWTCGLSRLGTPCVNGPDRNGRCCRSAIVYPACTHLNSPAPCESCHTPCARSQAAELPVCVPIRNRWRDRNVLAINTAILAGTALLIALAVPSPESLFAPGPLSSKHAQILSNKVVSQRCALCHPQSHQGQFPAQQTSASGDMLPAQSQDELCMRCHTDHLKNLGLRSPHDLPREELRKLSQDQIMRRGQLVSYLDGQTSKLSDRIVASEGWRDAQDSLKSDLHEKTYCASCHSEHHGRDHDLQAISDQRCQACHQYPFASFSNGHPDFSDYPKQRARYIAFSHDKHLTSHFAKKNREFVCADCHVDVRQSGNVGSVFRTLGFDVACAGCHNEPIKAAITDGWAVLQIPSVVSQDTQSPDHGLSDWPASAQFGYEGKIPFPMLALLLADDEVDQFLPAVAHAGDLKALPDFKARAPEVSRKLARATRRLIQDTARFGQQAWRKRIETVIVQRVGRLQPGHRQLIERLTVGLPPDLFRQIEHQWFQGPLISDNRQSSELIPANSSATKFQLTNYQTDDLLASPVDAAKNAASDEADLFKPPAASTPKYARIRGAVQVAGGGWYVDHETLGIRFMPSGHADPTLAAWSELAQVLNHPASNPSASIDSRDSLAPLSLPLSAIPGGCTECHNLHITTDGFPGDAPNPWQTFRLAPSTREMTRFDHTPHLTLPALKNCVYCHQLPSSAPKKTASVLVSIEQSSPNRQRQIDCEFDSISISQCVACHRPSGAPTGCVQCHNYHVSH